MNNTQHLTRLKTVGLKTGLILLFLLAFNLGHAGTTGHNDLNSLYTLAKQHDPTYLSAASQLQADLETENQARSALLPNIKFGGRIEKQENTYGTFGQSASTPILGTYSLVLNQALFRPEAWVNYKQSQLSGEIAKLSFQQAEQELILRLSRAYFNLLASQDNIAHLKDQKKAVLEQLAFAKANFEVGNTTITDQQEAQARFDLIVAQELALENQLAVQQLQLEHIVGVPVDSLAKLQPNIKLDAPTPNVPNTWAELALENNLMVKQAKLAQLIAKSEVKKANAGHLPTLDLNAQMVESEQQTFDRNSGQAFGLDVKSTTVGLVMNLPIFNGGGTQSKVRQQAALLEKALNQVELNNKNAAQAAKTAFLGLQSSLAQIKALETAVSSNELALQSNKTAYQVGIRINIDVLNAQQQLNATQRDLSKAKYTSLINMLELQAATGQLHSDALLQINKLLTQ